MRKYLVSIMILFFVLGSACFSQTDINSNSKTSKAADNDIIISIDSVKVQKSQSSNVVVPVRVKNFKKIGAITLKITYDTLNLRFINISNVSGITNANYSSRNGVITLGWFDASAVTGGNVNDGIFFNMNFTLSGESSDIKFLTDQCDIADINAQSLKVSYINGAALPGSTDVKQIKKKSTDFKLGQNFPNPFNPETNIEFSISKASNVKLKVFNLLGREVATLVDQFKSEGNYKITFAAIDLPSGIYLYKLDAGEYSEVKKMMIAK